MKLIKYRQIAALITSRMFYVILGFFISLVFYGVSAATWQDIKNTGDALTAKDWTDMADVVDLKASKTEMNTAISTAINNNACKKVDYAGDTSNPPATVNFSCGANYYVVSVMDTSGNLANPGAAPLNGTMICCKNSD